MKFASGNYTHPAGSKKQVKMSVTGLGFRPLAIVMASAYQYNGSSYISGTSVWGICDPDGEPAAYHALTVGGYSTTGAQYFIPNDDGFDFWAYDYTEPIPYSWWAIGK